MGVEDFINISIGYSKPPHILNYYYIKMVSSTHCFWKVSLITSNKRLKRRRFAETIHNPMQEGDFSDELV